jgi:hypothetical protein
MPDPIPPQPDKQAFTLHLRLTEDMRQALQDVADERGVTLSHVARSLLLWGLKELGNG